MQLVVTEAFWALFPTARIGVVTIHELDNTVGAEAAATLLMHEAEVRAASLAGVDIATHVAIAPWQAAYSRFGVKPSKFRSSIESLLRTAQAGRTRPINPLVDLYNAVSLRHALLCGDEDLATLVGDVRLTRAEGGEPFRTIGATSRVKKSECSADSTQMRVVVLAQEHLYLIVKPQQPLMKSSVHIGKCGAPGI